MVGLKDIYIGNVIREKFEQKRANDRNFTKAEFARRVGIHRSTIYPLFHQKSIDIELLINISEVLEYNFIEEIYVANQKVRENRIVIGIEVSEEQLQKSDLLKEFMNVIKGKSETDMSLLLTESVDKNNVII